jgi:arsenite oxidase small subunit
LRSVGNDAQGSMMQRRQFLSACAAIAGASGVGAMNGEWMSATPRLYPRSLLIDRFGEPIKVAGLATRTNYVFQYPFAGTPCFLLNLGRPLAGADKLLRADGAPYAWSGGVGRQRSIVAYSAICAHKLAYPTREVSFIRYQPERSPTSDGNVIHCCADHSVYDPAAAPAC